MTQFFQYLWGNQVSDIFSSDVPGVGFDLGYSKLETGNHVDDFFESNHEIAEQMFAAIGPSGSDEALTNTGTLAFGAEVAFHLTQHGTNFVQGLANAASGTKNAILDIGELKLLKGVKFEGAAGALTVLGLGVTAVDIHQHGININNGLDAIVGIASLITPGVGWVIGGTYFFANLISKAYTGKTLRDHLADLTGN